LPDNSRFCNSCGAAIELEVDQSPAVDAQAAPVALESSAPGQSAPAEPSLSPRKSRRTFWIAAATIVVLIIAAIAAGVLIVDSHNKHVAEQKAKQVAAVAAAKAKHAADIASYKRAEQQALAPFSKLSSALSVGIQFSQYGTMVENAQYAFDSYQPSEPVGVDFRRNLKSAMSAYRAAYDAWNDDIQSKFTGSVSQGSYWTKRYPVLIGLKTSTVTPNDVEQEGWGRADVGIAAAQVELARYGGQ
jgi:hypothetical protein